MKEFLKPETITDLLDGLEKQEGKKTLLIDMDGVVADFDKAAVQWARDMGITTEEFMDKKYYRQEGFYLSLELIPGAFEAIQQLSAHYYIRFLSAPSWGGHHSFTEKRLWIAKKFGPWSEKLMDLTFRKDLFLGHYLIDDRTKYGAGKTLGKHIVFGNEEYPNWEAVLKELIPVPIFEEPQATS